MAWWWKDVIVRKSLLEECVGEKYVYKILNLDMANDFERFERVLVALSTHALMKKSSKPIALDSTSVGSNLNN